MSPRWIAVIALQCSMTSCGGSSATTCTKDDDCASHFCKADGTCGDATIDAPLADGAADAPSGACTPDHDGHITMAELPLVPGRMATFRTATNVAIDTAGTANGDGSRTWDYTAQLSGDADDAIALAAPTGTWWAADFPAATYAAPLSASSDLLGVFAVSASSVTLLGVVSPEGGTLSTELTYDPPAAILGLPITAGGTWTTTSTVSGTAQGVITAYTEKYASRVDEVGTMKTPYGPFPVLRIATDLTRTAGVTTLLTERSFAWAAECFGSVASIQGKDFDTSAELSSAAEVRRLAP
jgi:hypothetical protein